AEVADLAERKLGGLRPWAWSPDSSEFLRPLAASVSASLPWQWQGDAPALWFSKEIGLRLGASLGLPPAGSLCHTLTEAERTIAGLHRDGAALVKAVFSCAGKGHRLVSPGDDPVAA